MRLPFFAASFAAMLALAAAAPAQPAAADRDFQRAQRLDARVATVGHRLAVASLDLCADRQWRWGFVVADIAALQSPYRDSATRAFGVVAGLGVMALVAGGPAERAGLRAHDVILALDGRAPAQTGPQGPGRGTPAAADMLASLDEAFADGRALVEAGRAAARVTIAIEADRSCATRFQATPSGSRRAYADGRVVGISAAMVDYAADDAELAAVVAHELAHNILRHRVRLDGVARGVLGIGRDTRRIRETEIEADRLSVYLMERAGYDPEAAVRFWERFGPHPLNFLRVRDHPGWRSRVQSLRTEIAEIRRARAAGTVPIPAFARLPLPPRPAG